MTFTAPRRLIVAGLAAVAAFALVLAATDPPGPGLDPDAMQYMGAAESLARHGIYQIPSAPWWSADSVTALAHFPPGFSTALAVPVRYGMSPPQAARLIDAIAASITAATVVLLVSEATTLLAGALAAVALYTMAAMHLVHMSVLSEPLFLAWTALTLAVLARRTRPVVMGLPAAAGILTRYAGLSLVGAVAIWAYADGEGTPRERIRRALLAVSPAAVLQGAWVIRTKQIGGPAEIRHFAWYGDLGPMLHQGGVTLRDWLVPDWGAAADAVPHRGWLALAAAIVFVALLVVGARRSWSIRRGLGSPPGTPPDAPLRLLVACALLVVCYLGMLGVSRLVADPGIPLDERLLSPVLLLATIAIATSIALWWRLPRRDRSHRIHRGARVALGAALVLWAAAGWARTYEQAKAALTWGSDFAGEQWRHSALLEWARTEGATQPLYSNWPSAVYFHLHRAARGLPAAADTAAFSPLADSLRARGRGVVLAFAIPDASIATGEQLRKLPGFEVIAELDDGIVLAVPR